jgi:hypothetical protein
MWRGLAVRMAATLAVVLCTVAAGSAAPATITKQQVIAALNAHGFSISPEQVNFLADPLATRPDAVLEMLSIEHWGAGRLSVRMGCRQREECVPFYVAVDPTNPDLQSPAQSLPVVRQTSRTPPVVRAGERAMLQIDRDKLHITMPVICLESGAVGGRIRVATSDHKQVYRAEVVGPKLLKGGF